MSAIRANTNTVYIITPVYSSERQASEVIRHIRGKEASSGEREDSGLPQASPPVVLVQPKPINCDELEVIEQSTGRVSKDMKKQIKRLKDSNQNRDKTTNQKMSRKGESSTSQVDPTAPILERKKCSVENFEDKYETELGSIGQIFDNVSIHSSNSTESYDSSSTNAIIRNQNSEKVRSSGVERSETNESLVGSNTAEHTMVIIPQKTKGTGPSDIQGAVRSSMTRDNYMKLETSFVESERNKDEIDELFTERAREQNISEACCNSNYSASEVELIEDQADLNFVTNKSMVATAKLIDRQENKFSVDARTVEICQFCMKRGHTVDNNMLVICSACGYTFKGNKNSLPRHRCSVPESDEEDEKSRWWPRGDRLIRVVRIHCPTCEGHGYTRVICKDHREQFQSSNNQEVSSPTVDPTHLSRSHHDENGPIICQLCKGQGHGAKDCPDRPAYAFTPTTIQDDQVSQEPHFHKKADNQCQICKKLGHGAYRCPFRYCQIRRTNHHPRTNRNIKDTNYKRD